MSRIIEQADLNTNIYPEIITEITRGDNTIVDKAIDNAIEETKSFLNRYDLNQLFGDGSTSPSFTSAMLQNIVKDVAVWWLVKLANPNINYEHAKVCYEDAIASLKMIQSGRMVPPGWPLMDYSNATTTPGDAIVYTSNPKRCTRF
jgi:hypothetical protein